MFVVTSDATARFTFTISSHYVCKSKGCCSTDASHRLMLKLNSIAWSVCQTPERKCLRPSFLSRATTGINNSQRLATQGAERNIQSRDVNALRRPRERTDIRDRTWIIPSCSAASFICRITSDGFPESTSSAPEHNITVTYGTHRPNEAGPASQPYGHRQRTLNHRDGVSDPGSACTTEA